MLHTFLAYSSAWRSGQCQPLVPVLATWLAVSPKSVTLRHNHPLFCVKYFFLLLFTAFAAAANAQTTYVQANTLEGEGAILFLKRFDIYNSCNLKQFFVLNQLKENAVIGAGKRYFLPIQIRAYDGKSIRSTLKTTDLRLALRLQSYNEGMNAMGYKAADFRVDKQLWIPYNELFCKEEAIDDEVEPVSGNPELAATNGKTMGPYPIFGEEYATIPVRSRRLTGCVFYLLSGHGGPDPGASIVYNGHTMYEDEYAYDITLRVARHLMAHGALVYILVRDPDDGIRDEPFLDEDKDERCWVNKPIPHSQKLRLEQRTNVVNALYVENKQKGSKYQRCIDFHLDSESSTLNMDMSFFFRYKSEAGREFAISLSKAMGEKYKEAQPNRAYRGFIQARNLHVVRETLPVSLLVELGNLKSSRDRKRFTIVENRKLLAEWLAYALLQDAEENN